MEEIYDGKKIYSLITGKWQVSALTPQSLIDREKEDERDGDTTDGQIWISKATGLPVHTKTDAPSETRYVFSGIAAPDVR